MRPAFDYSKDLRRKLADGKTLDQALTELRVAGATITDCVVSVRNFRRCEIIEAKRIVEDSSAWSDHRNIGEEISRVVSESDDKTVA
jgi:hypothetical protein